MKIKPVQFIEAATLLLIIAISVGGSLWFKDDLLARFYLLAFLCLGYTVWGIIIHLVIDKARHPKVIIEYILLGFLGLALASFILYH